jgi:hypothetical protein
LSDRRLAELEAILMLFQVKVCTYIVLHSAVLHLISAQVVGQTY